MVSKNIPTAFCSVVLLREPLRGCSTFLSHMVLGSLSGGVVNTGQKKNSLKTFEIFLKEINLSVSLGLNFGGKEKKIKHKDTEKRNFLTLRTCDSPQALCWSLQGDEQLSVKKVSEKEFFGVTREEKN